MGSASLGGVLFRYLGYLGSILFCRRAFGAFPELTLGSRPDLREDFQLLQLRDLLGTCFQFLSTRVSKKQLKA